MPSLISHFYRFIMRRASIFGKPNQTIAERRAQIEKAAGMAPIPRGVTVQPVDAGGVPAEWVIPTGAPDDRALLYIHGGAWIICSPRTHRTMIAQIARAAGMKALSIDYRLAPEHPFPAALDDCLAAYRWLLAQGISANKIAIGGDSAGGNLTLATLIALRDGAGPLPAASICLSPATDLASTGETRRTRAHVEVLLRNLKGGSVVTQYAGGHDVYEPLLSPLYGNCEACRPSSFTWAITKFC